MIKHKTLTRDEDEGLKKDAKDRLRGIKAQDLEANKVEEKPSQLTGLSETRAHEEIKEEKREPDSEATPQ